MDFASKICTLIVPGWLLLELEFDIMDLAGELGGFTFTFPSRGEGGLAFTSCFTSVASFAIGDFSSLFFSFVGDLTDVSLEVGAIVEREVSYFSE